VAAQTPGLNDVLDVLKHRIDEIPGIEANFSQPIRDNVNESISGQQGQIAVKLYGEDLTALQSQAERVKSVVSKVPGVADLALVKSASVLQIRVKPDRVALARYGMDLGDFQHVFQTALGGRPMADFWEGERKFDVVLRLPAADRNDVEDPLPPGAVEGMTIPLSPATLETRVGRPGISRENGRRYTARMEAAG
jgi:cobalt-zinc-cadmium resistance protein CzcA